MDFRERFDARETAYLPTFTTANHAVGEVRRSEFFRKGGRRRELFKGKRWLLLTGWINLSPGKGQELNRLFTLNRKLFKAYLLKESLERLRTYR